MVNKEDYNLFCEGVSVSLSVSMVRQIPLFRVLNSSCIMDTTAATMQISIQSNYKHFNISTRASGNCHL